MQDELRILTTIRLLRYSPPGKLDDVPYGSQCLVKKGNDNDVYVQVNPRRGDPKWHYIYRASSDSSVEDIDNRIFGELGLKFYD